MNIIRAKIICSWALLALFGVLLWFAWRYRFLWVALIPTAIVVLERTRPHRPPMPPKEMARWSARVKILVCLMVIVWVFSVVVHGFLYPSSAGLYLFCKIACAATAAPLFWLKARLDYVAWTAVPHESPRPADPGNAVASRSTLQG